ncbi:MAG: hypothetical protein Q9187_006560 [Circinaria calcarea]
MTASGTQSVTKDGIYLGFLINWSYGSIRGATLTLTNRNGGLLTAFLALFVTVAGTSFWRIACFALHHLLSSEVARDGIYHQCQAILRNAANGTSGLWSLLRMNWVWRKCTKAQPYQRLLPLIVFTFTTLVAIALAGIFSSRVSTSMGNEVLLLGPNCGIVVLGDIDTESYSSNFVPYAVQRTLFSASYAQECYKNSTTIQNCPTFLQKSLPWTSDHSAECPFPGGEKICLSNSTNLRLDTGYINSNFDLGINSPHEDRFLYRRVTECAPLNIKDYSRQETYQKSENTDTRQVIRFYYAEGSAGARQMVYQYSADSHDGYTYFNGLNKSAFSDYTIHVQSADIGVDGSVRMAESSFNPIPELRHPTADVTLVFLSANDVAFTKPINDSWYSAHLHHTIELQSFQKKPANLTLYYHDDPVRVLGCTSQYQFCNPVLEPQISCTPLDGIWAVQGLAEALWQTDRSKALFRWSSKAILENGIGLPEVIGMLGVSSLTSRYKLALGLQGPLPDNQWKLEVIHWFTVTLADLQRIVVDIATGPVGGTINQWLKRPQTPEEHLLCRSQVGNSPSLKFNAVLIPVIPQKIRNDAFTSFSTFGLILILGIGCLLIVVAYTLEVIVEWFQKRRNIGVYKCLEWTTNETLQLQRLAHEELGFGNWSRTAEDHPVTAACEELAVLDISEPQHPRLKSSAVKSETVSDHGGKRTSGTVEITEQTASQAGSNDAASISISASTHQDLTPPTGDARDVSQAARSSVNAGLQRHSTC